ncbi:NAD(P)-binding protein [Panus rudis PR-1116 ss-1]|nr:NAD(P)-binding protein [Panus rudis PR-1116 ss-1]
MGWNVAPLITTDLSNKTVLVTGANTGLGHEAAKHFARMKPQKLVVTCRTKEKGDATVKRIQQETGFAEVEAHELELSSFSSVLEFVKKFNSSHVGLDILVSNAALAMNDFQLTGDVNHLSTALMIVLLVPALARAASSHPGSYSRVVTVSSGAHAWPGIHLNETDFPGPQILQQLNSLDMFKKWGHDKRYAQSKLLNLLFTLALAEGLSSSSRVIVDAVNPRFCESDLTRHIGQEQFKDMLHLRRTTEEGSRELVRAAVYPADGDEEETKKMHGAYLQDSELALPSEWVRSEDGRRARELLWTVTIEILSQVDTGVKEIIDQHRK